ncbi:DUF1800 domain-containing protein [Flavihumibacter fluvii]|uniref:DUF1800 domain-containing protein n=1 Tax=Flavihumibacter fluvii TaxID=2838157 RepID=UPI001BDE6513|nr:DUF1800 domain-containing protein [Flavihumibacter fluvii]ULQ51197.1 DUF1800 domain-containing protein [Flavihumibacter fluvii]
MNVNQWKNQHLFWRAAFGPPVASLAQLQTGDPNTLYKALLKASAKSPDYLNIVDNAMKGLTMGIGEAGKMNRRELTTEEKKNLRKQSREDLKNLNIHWLSEMAASGAQLREKMAFFWHGHFACRNLNIYYQQLLLHTIRTNALGNFGELLREVSKSAAMINFLNNNQNRKDHPNENFARELMELFTMGRGNYAEKDIREAARAFTGWGANINGEFIFRRGLHDGGQKTFLGKTGNFTGDDILDILLEQPTTAIFITRKLYRFFVNEDVDALKVEWLAKRFYQSGYAIQELLHDMFTSAWFFDPKNMGNRIKSPVELWVGMRRQLPLAMQDEAVQLVFQKLLGQILFYPPNVAGWAGGKTWIDGSSLLLRMRLPQLVAANEGWIMQPKQDDDEQMGRAAAPGRNFNADINWEHYCSFFAAIKKQDVWPSISRFILQTPVTQDPAIINKYTNLTARQLYISSATINLMSCPEYQLC